MRDREMRFFEERGTQEVETKIRRDRMCASGQRMHRLARTHTRTHIEQTNTLRLRKTVFRFERGTNVWESPAERMRAQIEK